jgi:tetratricopeptide (TPR) repeat protein
MGRAVKFRRVYAIVFGLLIFVVSSPEARAQNPFSSGVPELDELDIRMSEPYSAGRFSETIPMHKQAIAIAEKALGRDHPTTIKRIEDCGDMLSLTGRTEEAKVYYERALARHKRVIAEKKKIPVDDITSLARLYASTEQYDKAEPLYKQVIEMREKLAETNDPINNSLFARAIDDLAMIYNKQGRFAEETIMRGRAVAAWEKSDATSIVPGTHMTDAAFIMLIAGYSVLDRHAEAEALVRRALAREQKSGETATTSYSIAMLADTVAAQGRLEEAEKLYRQALALERKYASSNSDKTSLQDGLAIHLNGLADVLLKLGRYDEAEAAATEALASSGLSKSELSEKHLTRDLLIKLAQTNRGKRRYAKAEEFYRRALALTKTLGEQESPKYGRFLGELAELHLAMGKVPEAYDLGKRATELLIRQIRNRGSALTMSPSGQLRPEDYYHKPTFMAHLRAASVLAQQSPDRAAELAAAFPGRGLAVTDGGAFRQG